MQLRAKEITVATQYTRDLRIGFAYIYIFIYLFIYLFIYYVVALVRVLGPDIYIYIYILYIPQTTLACMGRVLNLELSRIWFQFGGQRVAVNAGAEGWG